MKHTIQCPKCHEVFQVDEAGYAAILKQVRDKEFEREAKLWGLSEEDRRITKEEKMTPAEFIEAEEYDDDELLKDEWER